MGNLLANSETIVVSNTEAAATTDVNTTGVDLRNYQGCKWVCTFGAITAGAVTNVHLEDSDDDSTYTDLEGTSITVADDDDDKAFVLDLIRPKKRYARLVIDRATQNAVIESVTATAYDPNTGPVTQGATVGGSETHLSPAEGTI